MLPEQVREHATKVITEAQREFYFENGYLLLESVISADLLERLQAATHRMIEQSRQVTKSDAAFDLEPGHSADTPRLRRLSSPADHDPAYWELATESILPDIAADLVGPDVKHHHSKLNFKWAEGGEEVKWHQDIQGWPHTNYSPLTMGLYLEDVGSAQGPLGVISGSHDGELFDHYNEKDQWVGYILDKDMPRVDIGKAAYLEGPAGALTIHNCRTIHGSEPNNAAWGRPLLLNVFSAADAFTYTANPIGGKLSGQIVRGKPARWARHDPRPCVVPPDWSGGYTSIFAMQQEETPQTSSAQAAE